MILELLKIPADLDVSVLGAFQPRSVIKTKDMKFKSYKEIHVMKLRFLNRILDGKGLRLEIPAGTKPDQVSRLLRVLASKIDQARFKKVSDDDDERMKRETRAERVSKLAKKLRGENDA